MTNTHTYTHMLGLPQWASDKESTCQCRRHGFDPWVEKIPWRRKWLPTPIFLPGEPHRQRILAGYSPWGRKGVGHDLATEQQQQQYTYVHTHPLPLGFPLTPPLSLHPPRSSQSTKLSPLCHAAGMLTFILPMVVYLY